MAQSEGVKFPCMSNAHLENGNRIDGCGRPLPQFHCESQKLSRIIKFRFYWPAKRLGFGSSKSRLHLTKRAGVLQTCALAGNTSNQNRVPGLGRRSRSPVKERGLCSTLIRVCGSWIA